MRRRKVLENKPPPWANLVNSIQAKKSPSPLVPTTTTPETSSSSAPAPKGVPNATVVVPSPASVTAPPVAASEQPPKRRRKRKSRFDERPPSVDISAVMPQPKQDPLGTISDPMLRSKLEMTGELATHSTKRKHHISDYLPKEELLKFMAKAKGATVKTEDKTKITATNKGFGMLAKMGWKEGKGLGKAGAGITAPVAANGNQGGAGIGHLKPTDVTEKDDIFLQYKKRMALAYRYRPNPLGNPRTAYWEHDSMNKGATQHL